MKSDMITTCLVLGFLYAGSQTCSGTYQLSKTVTRSGYTILRREEEVVIVCYIEICFDCLCAAPSILLVKLRKWGLQEVCPAKYLGKSLMRP